jgi:hypothetical protein
MFNPVLQHRLLALSRYILYDVSVNSPIIDEPTGASAAIVVAYQSVWPVMRMTIGTLKISFRHDIPLEEIAAGIEQITNDHIAELASTCFKGARVGDGAAG